MYSLKRVLVLGTTILTTAVLVAAGATLYMLMRMSLVSELDRSLADRARLLASTIEIEGGRLDLELIDLDVGTGDGPHHEAYVQVWAADGATLYKSASLANADLDRRASVAGNSVCYSAVLPDGSPGRASCLTFLPRMETERAGEEGLSVGQGEGHLSLAVARSTSHIDVAMARLRLLLFLVGGVSVAVATCALGFYVARSLRPLNHLAHEIGQLGEDDLTATIGQTGYPRELEPVISRLNQLLSRVHTAFQRERTMNANVAHELRTPLTGLRLKLDVAVSRDRETQQYRQTLGECLAITEQLQQLVDNLLSLARLNAGQFELKTECVDLGVLIEDRRNAVSEETQRRRLQVHRDVAPQATLVTDRTLLGMAVRNLLANAVAYADEGGKISVQVRREGDRVEISVLNSGSNLSQEEAESALIPFWRHDPSRNSAGVHCGLGLSLVQQIALALGGQLSVKSCRGGQFEATIDIPSG